MTESCTDDQPLLFLSYVCLCSRRVAHAHRGHPRENAMYQRSDLLHRTDKSQDNYGPLVQQTEKDYKKNPQHAIQKSDLLVIWYVHEGQAVTLFLVIVHRVRTSDKCKWSIWRWNFNSRIQNRKVTVRLKKTPLTTRWHLSKQHCINMPSQKVIWLQTARARLPWGFGNTLHHFQCSPTCLRLC